MRMQGEFAHLTTTDDPAGRVASFVQLGLDAQPGRGARVADEFDDGFEGAERSPAPVLGDVAEQAMLDLCSVYSYRAESGTRGS